MTSVSAVNVKYSGTGGGAPSLNGAVKVLYFRCKKSEKDNYRLIATIKKKANPVLSNACGWTSIIISL